MALFQMNGQHVRRSAKTTKKAEGRAYLHHLLEECAKKAQGDDDCPRHHLTGAMDRCFAEATLMPQTGVEGSRLIASENSVRCVSGPPAASRSNLSFLTREEVESRAEVQRPT